MLRESPELALIAAPKGASRQASGDFFYPTIRHYLYAGDTPLHMAAAAVSKEVAAILISAGANPRARNRRGAEPVHYAADGDRNKNQADLIALLISAGANPNAVDRSGVAPIHRAVRKRSLIACRALLEGGADPRLRSGSGSTPLHLAVQTTGASGSGTNEARENQAGIITLLLQHGAKASDIDGKGKSVHEAATSEWIRELLI
jgi:hypothetical protein